MAAEFVEVLDTEATDVTVANTITLTELYSTTILGGTLDTRNRIRWQGQGKIGFNPGTSFTVYSFYAGATVASCILKSRSSATLTNKGFFLEATVNGDNSANSQVGMIRSELGLNLGDDDSTPVGFGTVGGASGGDQTFAVKGAWSATGATNSAILQHSTLELISFTEDTPAENLDEPTALLFISSKLNKLRYDLRKDVYAYLPLNHDLKGLCYGDVTFTRAAATVAIWRDGASHTVDANKGRFEYSGDTVLGLGINTSSETLNVDIDNTIHDSNTLIWLQDNVYKSTKRGDTNIFNASGNYTGPSGVHISEVVKFNRQITTAEDVEVEVSLT